MRTKKVGGFDSDEEGLKLIFKILLKIINTENIQIRDERIFMLHRILYQIWGRRSIWKKKLKRIKKLYCRELNKEKRDKCGKIIEVLEILTPERTNSYVHRTSINQSRSNRGSSGQNHQSHRRHRSNST